MRKLEVNELKEIKYSPKKQAGVYKIKNLINGKVYIGSSTDMYARKRNHISSLKRGEHYSHYLQNSWNKYGEENFEFSIIEAINNTLFPSKESLEDYILKREKDEIKRHKATDKSFGYNINSQPERSPMLGRKHSKQARKKMSEWQRGENNNNFGGNFSKQHRENMSKARKNVIRTPMSEESKRKISDTLKAKGHKPPKEAIEKSNLLRQRKVVQLNNLGVFIKSFDSIADASRETICGRACITACCQGKQKTSKGFKWMYIEDYKEMNEKL